MIDWKSRTFRGRGWSASQRRKQGGHYHLYCAKWLEPQNGDVKPTRCMRSLNLRENSWNLFHTFQSRVSLRKETTSILPDWRINNITTWNGLDFRMVRGSECGILCLLHILYVDSQQTMTDCYVDFYTDYPSHHTVPVKSSNYARFTIRHILW